MLLYGIQIYITETKIYGFFNRDEGLHEKLYLLPTFYVYLKVNEEVRNKNFMAQKI